MTPGWTDVRRAGLPFAAALALFSFRSAVSGGATPAAMAFTFLAAAALVFLAARRLAIKEDQIGLALLAGLLAVARLQGLTEPLERDITGYAVTAHEIVKGGRLLTDIWGMRPPLVYATFGLFELIGGYGGFSIFLLNVSFSLVTLVSVYVLGRSFGPVSGAGLMAAAVWTLISGHVVFEANQPNCEVLINAATMSAFAILASSGPGASRGRLLAAGLLLACASQYKQVAVVTTAALLLVQAVLVYRATSSLRAAATAALTIGAPTVLLWAGIAGYFVVSGRGRLFIDTYFVNTAHYVETSREEGHPLALLFRFFGKGTSVTYAAMAAAGAASLLGALYSRRRAAWASLLAVYIAALVQIMVPGRYFPHYLQYLLPLVAVGGAWCLAALPGPRAHLAGFAVLFIGLAVEIFPQARLSAEALSTLKYGPIFVDERVFARWIADLVQPGERIFVWNNAPGLYFYSDRRPGSSVLWVSNAESGPMSGRLRETISRQIAERRTELVLLDRVRTPPLIFDFFREQGWVLVGRSPNETVAYDALAHPGGRLAPRPEPQTVPPPPTDAPRT